MFLIENNVKIKQYISVDISFIFRKTIGITYSILFTFNIAFHIFPLLKLSSGRIIVFSRWKPSDFLNYTVVWKSRPEPWFFDHGLHASCHTSHHSGGSTSQIRKKNRWTNNKTYPYADDGSEVVFRRYGNPEMAAHIRPASQWKFRDTMTTIMKWQSAADAMQLGGVDKLIL